MKTKTIKEALENLEHAQRVLEYAATLTHERGSYARDRRRGQAQIVVGCTLRVFELLMKDAGVEVTE
jgi:hypothetical protein